MMRTRRFFLVALLSFMALSAVFAPLHAAYADDLSNTIVPKCQADLSGPYAGFSGACQLCDLVTLARNLINFAVAFSVIVATLMFTYAGVLYFTASAKADNIKKAHSIFVKVLVGLVIILVAWLVIDLIMRSLVGQRITAGSFGPWNSFHCADYPTSDRLNTSQTSAVSVGGGGGGGGGLPYNATQDRQVRLSLTSRSSGQITFNHDGCAVSTAATPCTNLNGLTQPAQDGLVTLQHDCNCAIQVTGGTEMGPHDTHTGNQVDVAFSPQIATQLNDPAIRNALHIRVICTSANHESAIPSANTSCTESQDHIHIDFGG